MRRRVDWNLSGHTSNWARSAPPPFRSSPDFAVVAAALDAPSPEIVDHALRHAVELARTKIGLERASIFLVDTPKKVLVGTWGTGANGETVDEHDTMFELGVFVREFFTRSEYGFLWTIYDDCPHMAHAAGETRIIGRGWLACTAIRCATGPVGIMFNDAALTGKPPDESTQARVATLCALVGQVLERCNPIGTARARLASSDVEAVVAFVERNLSADIGLSDLAQLVGYSPDHLARLFKNSFGVPLYQYILRRRVEKAKALLRNGSDSIAEVALACGFANQSHLSSVFKVKTGVAPGAYRRGLKSE